ASALATVVLPSEGSPVNRYAWDRREVSSWLARSRRTAWWPATPLNGSRAPCTRIKSSASAAGARMRRAAAPRDGGGEDGAAGGGGRRLRGTVAQALPLGAPPLDRAAQLARLRVPAFRLLLAADRPHQRRLALDAAEPPLVGGAGPGPEPGGGQVERLAVAP